MRKVIITTIGTQKDEGGEENRIELISAGRYYEKSGVHCITYRESEISGMEDTTTLIKVYEDHFSLIRMGAVEQKQEFLLGQHTSCMYITPFGAMEMGIYTKTLEIDVQAGAGSVTAAYELQINGQWQSSNTLSISLREETKS